MNIQEQPDSVAKFNYVWERLKDIGVDVVNIGEAVDDANFEKSYRLLRNNPQITKGVFLLEMGFEDESVNTARGELIAKEYRYWRSIGLNYMEVKMATDDDNWDIVCQIMQEKPLMTRNEFLRCIGIEDIDAFNKECQECIVRFNNV